MISSLFSWFADPAHWAGPNGVPARVLEHLGLQVRADHRVHGGERLVHEQDVRVRGEGAGHAHTLALAAGELGGVSGGDGRGQADELEQLVRVVPVLAGDPAGQARHGEHVVQHGAVRQQAGVLHDVADAAAQLHGVQGGDVTALDEHAATGGVYHPVHHLQERGLAAAGGAQQHGGGVRGDLEGEVLHGTGTVREGLHHMLEADHAVVLPEDSTGVDADAALFGCEA